MVMFAPFVIATLAQSEPVTIGYSSHVELVMLTPENASFVCAGSDRPAQLEINEDSPGVVSTNFPLSLRDGPEGALPSVGVRRGTELIRQRVSTLPNLLRNNNWNITVSGKIDFCVGPATLRVVGGRLNVFANLGRYEGSIISSDNVLEDLDISYAVNASGMDQLFFWHLGRDGWPTEVISQLVGSEARAEGRILGRLDFDATQLPISFSSQSDIEDVTHLTRLNVRLLLIEEALPSDLPTVIHDEIAEDDG